MIKKEIFDKLSEYKDISSWAVWPENGKLYDESIFKYTNNKLNNKFMFISLNPHLRNNNKELKPFEGFHVENGAGDKNIKRFLNNDKFIGSYITDLVKDDFEGKENIVYDKILTDNHRLEENKQKILNEIKLLDIPYIIIFGKGKTTDLFKKMFKDCDWIKFESLYHFTKGSIFDCTDEVYFKTQELRINKILEKIENGSFGDHNDLPDKNYVKKNLQNL